MLSKEVSNTSFKAFHIRVIKRKKEVDYVFNTSMLSIFCYTSETQGCASETLSVFNRPWIFSSFPKQKVITYIIKWWYLHVWTNYQVSYYIQKLSYKDVDIELYITVKLLGPEENCWRQIRNKETRTSHQEKGKSRHVMSEKVPLILLMYFSFPQDRSLC